MLHKVPKPEIFGVAKVDKNNKITHIKEKPKKFLSDQAITGLYFFDKDAPKLVKRLKPSSRGELEIIDLISIYLEKGELNVEILGRGNAWLDAGTPESLIEAHIFVQTIEHRQGLKIACIEEIAFEKGWINQRQLLQFAEQYSDNNYCEYIKDVVRKSK